MLPSANVNNPITADSVVTVDDVGDINEIRSNVRFNLNSES
jgi:hypothetical protein